MDWRAWRTRGLPAEADWTRWERATSMTLMKRDGGRNSVIVVVGVGKEVRTAREGIRAGEEFAWDVDHFQVEVCKVDKPTGLSLVEVLGGTEVGEVLMVGEDLDWEGGSVEVVPP